MKKEMIISILRQHRVAMVLCAFAVVFIALLVVRVPMTGELESELESERMTLRRMQQNLAQGEDLRGHLDTIKTQVVQIDERLMERREVAVNYDYFYRMEEAAGVRIQNIQQQAQAAGSAVTLPRIELYDVIGYSVTAQGGFEDIVDFIQQLESGRHFVRIQSVNLSSAGQAGSVGRLNAQIELNVLGRKP
ncbi:MAG: hypothetical protein JJU00_12015 [Opitutales bacterium]|nr:hypothetical protein [Opitutales bacterium]